MRLGKDARKRTKRVVRKVRRVSQRITRQKVRPVKRARQTAAKSAKKSARELTAPQARVRRQARKRLRAEQRRPRSPNADTLFAAVQRLIDDQLFAGLKRHGNHRWTMHPLFVVALVWVWTCEPTLTESFHVARATADGWLSGVFLGRTYQGFIGALTVCSQAMLGVVQRALRTAMRQKAGRSWLVCGWLVFAVDGTKFEVPWTVNNENELGDQQPGWKSKKRRRKRPPAKRSTRHHSASRPQIFSTHVWHVGMALPWAWKNGAFDASERGQLQEMLDLLPPEALLVADAGFTGYPLWSTLIAEKRFFLIRIGSNIHLLRKLGCDFERHGDIVYFWPARQRQQGQQPLAMRLISFGQRKSTVHLATSVLDPKKLTAAQAQTIYRKRWGIECHFRAAKSTFERKKLRSYTAKHARVELDWSLLGLWLVGLMAVEQLQSQKLAPDRLSAAAALKTVRWHLRHGTTPRGSSLRPLGFLESLRAAAKDNYQRESSKKCRHDVRQKTEAPPKPPKIKTATATQRAEAKPFLEILETNA